MTAYSILTQNVLKKTGWYPERSIAIDEFLDDFKEAYCSIPDFAIRFLREFGGLTLAIEFDTARGLVARIKTNVVLNIYGQELIDSQSKVANDLICPIGEISRPDIWEIQNVLLLGQSGVFYFSHAHAEDLYQIASNLDDLVKFLDKDGPAANGATRLI